MREAMAERRQYIEENRPALEAIHESKRVQAYFETDEQAEQFIYNVKAQKERLD